MNLHNKEARRIAANIAKLPELVAEMKEGQSKPPLYFHTSSVS